MKHRSILAIAVTFLTVVALSPPSAYAQATRVFVAGLGADSNPCSFALPCRSFQHAHDIVASGGEIIPLDDAGYGTIVINKSISINTPAGIYAGISVASGTGVLINGVGINVLLKGVTIIGQGAASGLAVASGSVRIESSAVSGFLGSGIIVSGSGSLRVTDSMISRNADDGITINTTGTVDLLRVRVEDNASTTQTAGIDVASGTVLISQCVISGNATSDNGAGVFVTGSTTKVSLDRSVVTRNGNTGIAGVFVSGGARLVATGNTVTQNGVGFANSSGTFITVGDNTVTENGVDTMGTFTPASHF
jgi:hypothetical protein